MGSSHTYRAMPFPRNTSNFCFAPPTEERQKYKLNAQVMPARLTPIDWARRGGRKKRCLMPLWGRNHERGAFETSEIAPHLFTLPSPMVSYSDALNSQRSGVGHILRWFACGGLTAVSWLRWCDERGLTILRFVISGHLEVIHAQPPRRQIIQSTFRVYITTAV